eukprot:PRCOL_00000513-RA
MWGRGEQTEAEHNYVVLWPTSFSECASAISQLKEGSTVVINLSAIGSVDEQQRSIDFVAGGCYAMDGHQECLAEGVFLFAPSDMPVATASSRRDALVSLAKVSQC